jgi:two-component system LytT family response regulator
VTPSRLTALIVDDEPPARRKVRKFLAADPDLEVVGEAGSGEEAVEAIRRLAPDVVFLDVQMGRMDGFGVLEALEGGRMPRIVFVTAHDEFALRAFEVAAVDYLLKPFDADRFRRALERAKESVRAGVDAGLERRMRELLAEVRGGAPAPARILVKTRNRAILLKVADIAWIRAAGNYVELHAGEGEFLLRETLEGMERQLARDTFLRVHRSFLVNVEHVQEIRPWSHGDHLVLMRDGASIRLSRRYRDRLPEPIRRSL